MYNMSDHFCHLTTQMKRHMSILFHYDCGIELTITGDYGRPSYSNRLLSLRAEYLILLINFSAFVISLFTQPDGQSKIHGNVISPELPVRHYCTGQLFTVWHHLQRSTNMSVEDVAMLVKICLESFIKVSQP